jgi:hypothetical protein
MTATRRLAAIFATATGYGGVSNEGRALFQLAK